VIVTGHVYVENSSHASCTGSIHINGILKTWSNSTGVGVLLTDTELVGGASTHEISKVNAAVSWTGDVTAGSILAVRGLTLITAGRVSSGEIEYTYLN
jgi:hypothetical protein